MEPCATCDAFRSFRPLTQLLARELGIADQQLVSELLRMMQDEREKQDAEAKHKVELLRLDEVEWRTRPQMSDCCGLREKEGHWLLHELKNRNGGCDDHHQAAVRACVACGHRSPGDGEARDRAMIDRFHEVGRDAAALGQGGTEQALSNFVQRIGMLKAFEAAQAYYAGKLTFRPPEYLSFCRVYSTAEEFVPCAVKNPHDRCPLWSECGSREAQAVSRPGAIALDEKELGLHRG